MHDKISVDRIIIAYIIIMARSGRWGASVKALQDKPGRASRDEPGRAKLNQTRSNKAKQETENHGYL